MALETHLWFEVFLNFLTRGVCGQETPRHVHVNTGSESCPSLVGELALGHQCAVSAFYVTGL